VGVLNFIYDGLIASFVPLLSLVFGYYLVIIAKEEIKQGKKYFKYFEYAIYAFILILGLFYSFNIFLIIIASILILTNFHKKFFFFVKFLLFGLLYGVSVGIENLFQIIIAVLFILGLILVTNLNIKSRKEKFVNVSLVAVFYYMVGYLIVILVKYFNSLI
jgi:hypothetical protein